MIQAYFTVPKALEKGHFADLSVEARYLYGRMRDTLKLSIENGWKDEFGYYIKMARETMGEILKRCLPKVRKIINELKEAGLIIDRRMGLTKCNRIYIKLLDGETIEDLQTRGKQGAQSKENLGFKPDRNGFSPNNRNPNQPKNINHNQRVPWSKNLPKNHWWWENGRKVCWTGATQNAACIGRYYEPGELNHLITSI